CKTLNEYDPFIQPEKTIPFLRDRLEGLLKVTKGGREWIGECPRCGQQLIIIAHPGGDLELSCGNCPQSDILRIIGLPPNFPLRHILQDDIASTEKASGGSAIKQDHKDQAKKKKALVELMRTRGGSKNYARPVSVEISQSVDAINALFAAAECPSKHKAFLD